MKKIIFSLIFFVAILAGSALASPMANLRGGEVGGSIHGGYVT